MSVSGMAVCAWTGVVAGPVLVDRGGVDCTSVMVGSIWSGLDMQLPIFGKVLMRLVKHLLQNGACNTVIYYCK